MRRPPIWQLCCLTLTVIVLVVGYLHLGESETARLREYLDNARGSHKPSRPAAEPAPAPALSPKPNPVEPTPAKPAEVGQTPTTSSPADSTKPVDAPPTTAPPPEHAKEKPINATLMEKAPSYVKAIMDPFDTTFSRLDCPALDQARYAGLRTSKSSNFYASDKSDKAAAAADDEDAKPKKIMYYFTLNLRGAAHILPRLLSSVVTAIRYLGRGSCMLAIVEGNSDDGTWEILTALVPELRKAGIRFELKTSDINPAEGDQRIVRLAQLRNLALDPLTSADPATIDKDATVIFLNDVAACPEDILELVYQKKHQEAEMTCAMDWSYMLRNPTFYDAWIARTMKGETFFHIPPTGSWEDAWHMFWNDDETNRQFEFHRPFQVYACWNGAVAFSAKLVLGENGIRFRHSDEPTECYQGEPTLFCKDMWRRKLGRIAVVPTINLVYSDADGRKIKSSKGFVGELVNEDTDTKIEWKPDPPEKVKCWREYANQMWTPWDQGGPTFQ